MIGIVFICVVGMLIMLYVMPEVGMIVLLVVCVGTIAQCTAPVDPTATKVAEVEEPAPWQPEPFNPWTWRKPADPAPVAATVKTSTVVTPEPPALPPSEVTRNRLMGQMYAPPPMGKSR